MWLNGCATKEKKIECKEKSSNRPLSRGEGGLKALVTGPLRKELFFAASQRRSMNFFKFSDVIF